MDENYLNTLLNISPPKMSELPQPTVTKPQNLSNNTNFQAFINSLRDKTYTEYMSTHKGTALDVNKSKKILNDKSSPLWLKEIAYKNIVNYNAKLLNLKPLNFSKSIEDFNKLNKLIIEKYNELTNALKTKINFNKQDLQKNLLRNNSLANTLKKLSNDESITPSQGKILNKRLSNDLDGSKFWNSDKPVAVIGKGLANLILVKPFKYGESLVDRAEAKHEPLIIPVIKDAYKLGKDTLKITWDNAKWLAQSIYGVKGVTGSKDGVIAKLTRHLLTYEQELIKTGKSKTFNKDVNAFKKFVKHTKNTIVNVSSFVRKHPIEAGGIALSSLAVMGAKVVKEANKDPEHTLAFALSFYAPGVILKAGETGYMYVRNSDMFMNAMTKLQELNPRADFVVKYVGKSFEPHKGEFDQYLVTFKGDVLERNGEKLGVIRVQTPSLKNPTSILDKMLGRKPGQFKRVYRISSKEILLRNTPSEYADVLDELRKGGKVDTLIHSTTNNFLEKAWKRGKEFEVRYMQDIPYLKKRIKTGGIELGMFYAPSTNKAKYLEKLNTIIPANTPQAYIHYTEVSPAKFEDLLRGKAVFKLFNKKYLFIKNSKIDKLNINDLKKGYRELAQVLGEDVGKNKLSASTLKRVRTELETIDAPFTKNILEQKTSIRLPTGEKFIVYLGKTKQLTDKELQEQILKYIDAKFKRVDNVIKYGLEHPNEKDKVIGVIKNELQSIERLKNKVRDLKKVKRIEKLINDYKENLGLKTLKLTHKEAQAYNKVLENVKKIERAYYEKLSKVYDLKNLISDLAKTSYKIKLLLLKHNIKPVVSSNKSKGKKIINISFKPIQSTVKNKSSKTTSINSQVKTSNKKLKPSKRMNNSLKNIKISNKIKNTKLNLSSNNITNNSPKPGLFSDLPINFNDLKNITKNTIKKLNYNRNKKQERILYNIRIRAREDELKLRSKSNKLIIKIIKARAPFNKAFNIGAKYIDTNLARSFELIPIGKAKTTDEEILSYFLKKFRPHKTAEALYFVEKKKYSLDSIKEKEELKNLLKNKKNK